MRDVTSAVDSSNVSRGGWRKRSVTLQHRIASLPRRNWTDLVEETLPVLNAALCRDEAHYSLRPIQAVSIREALECGGVFVMADVGMGKTLISLLVGEVMQEERVLILVPNGDKAKTEDEFDEYRKAWRGIDGTKYKLFGYTDVSRWPKEGYSIQRLWGGLGPTLIICDEAEKLRRVHSDTGEASGLALQVNDFLAANPSCKLIALTATPDKSGVRDYAHILSWCLRDGSPLPREADEVAMWSSVIDKGDTTNARKVCIQMGIDPTDDLEVIRDAYHMRLKQTPGVLITDEGFQGPLSFECHLVEPPPLMVPHFHRARKLNQRPDGWDLSPDGPDEDEERKPDRITEGGVWACERQLALGFCYIADPVPPEPWMTARRMWFRAVRACLRDRDLGFYTALQVSQAAAQGLLKSAHQRAYEEWEKIRPSFEPGHRALWLDDSALDWCEAWGREAPGIIYVDHIAFGLELAKRTGWSYFQGKGVCGRRRIDKLYKLGTPASETVIAARAACGTGKNLQAWNRILFSAIPANNKDFQQNVGRIHRAGQWRPCKVDVLVGCKAHVESVAKVLDDAARQSQSIMKQKATTFPWEFPADIPEGVVFDD